MLYEKFGVQLFDPSRFFVVCSVCGSKVNAVFALWRLAGRQVCLVCHSGRINLEPRPDLDARPVKTPRR